MEKSPANDSTDRKQQSTKVLTECKICGAPAAYSYCGAMSCHPCKMFFKRNAERGQEAMKCVFHGYCQVNIKNRHICSYCRLAKCFEIGMQIEKIRSSFSKTKTNKTSQKRKITEDPVQTTSTAVARLNEHESFSTLNLLQSDQSTLNIDQWNLLSNLTHCYDAHSGLSRGERYMREQNDLPLKLRFKCASLIELCQVTLDGTQLLYKSNPDFLSLSANDRSTLLHKTFIHTGSLSLTSIFQQVRLLSNATYYHVVEMTTHASVLPAAKSIAGRLDSDVIMIKLFLAILSFSTISYTVYSNTPPVNLSNIKQILQIQDSYVELTWRYLLYKGSYEQAIKCFSDFIRCLFAVNEAIVKTQDVKWLTDTIDSIIQQTDQSLTLHD